MSNEDATMQPPVGDPQFPPQDDTIYYPNGGIPFKVVVRYDLFSAVAERMACADDTAEEEEEQESEEESADSTVVVEEPFDPSKLCDFCGYNHCWMLDHYRNLVILGTELEESEVYSNKEIRFHLYREFAHMYWGKLGAGNRRKLPHCVVAEIHDAYPKSGDEDYVGFKPSSTSA
jgi:hypothetical protein